MPGKETALTRRIVSSLRVVNAVVLNKIGNFREGRGWPDLYIAHKRFHGWLKLKVDAPVSQAQRDMLRMLERQHVPALVMRLVADRHLRFTRWDDTQIGELVIDRETWGHKGHLAVELLDFLSLYHILPWHDE